jgi:hypothetical protein
VRAEPATGPEAMTKPTSWLGRYLGRVLHVLGDLWVCSYPLLAVLILIAVVFKTAQGVEITRDLHEIFSSVTPPGARPFEYAMTILAVGYCTLAIFFASASALGRNGHAKSTVPYWLALLCLLSCFGIILGEAAAFALIAAAVVIFFLMPAFDPMSGHFHLSVGELAHRIAGVLLIIGAAVAFGVYVQPVAFPRALSTWPIVYTALGTWTLFWTLVAISLPRSRGWPSFWLAPIVVAVLCSLNNDNHALDVLPPIVTATPTPFQAYVDDWLTTHCSSKPQPCTVRFIAAHGGGQRAAYWTQAVLVALHDRERKPPDFDHTVFAFSGVSGGSLGGLSYYLARRSGAGDWRTHLHSAASADNLSPMIAAMMYRGALQAFIPVPVPTFDRARWYERGVEDAWNDAFTGSTGPSMSAAFPPRSPDTPAIFLNSTVVESGKRFVNASVLPPATFLSDAVYVGAFQPFVASPIRNSTAAHLSSRFSYSNPHATLAYHDGQRWGRVVDGGYNEGTGLLTLLEVVDAFRNAAHCTTCGRVSIEITYIANNPAAEDDLDGTSAQAQAVKPGQGCSPPSPTPTQIPKPVGKPFLWELNTPITGTVNAHFIALTSALRNRVLLYRELPSDPKIPSVSFRVVSLKRLIDDYTAGALGKPQEPWCEQYASWQPALGWWLSKHSVDQMNLLLGARDAKNRSLIDLIHVRSASR